MSDSSANSQQTLWMITGKPVKSQVEGEKGGGAVQRGRLGDRQSRSENDLQPAQTEETNKVPISVGKMQQNLNQFLVVVGDLFVQAEQQAQIDQPGEEEETKRGIKLDQIELSVAVNAEGEVGFWGLAQGKVGGATEIKLTFTRQEA